MNVEDFKKKYEQLKDNPMYKNFCSILDTKSQVLERTAKENKELKKQLDYLRSGEYLNQLRFERDMLQHVVDNSKVSKVDKEFIDMTYRNTELLAQQKEFIEWLERRLFLLRDEASELVLEMCSTDYQDTKIEIYKEVLSKYKEITGVKDE